MTEGTFVADFNRHMLMSHHEVCCKPQASDGCLYQAEEFCPSHSGEDYFSEITNKHWIH